ncbi:MAG: glycoside hydrolase family 9 protein [Chlorobia bacterium]|nr:glycoside hydrolase family 9 protein [Fimbriimonadaceae bacterium]
MLGMILASSLMLQSDQIRVCQVGYLPQETKFAMVVAMTGQSAVIKDARTDKAVGTFPVGFAVSDPSTGDLVRPVDFSAVKTPGAYYLEIEGVGKSYTFRIAKDVFAPVYRIAMRSYLGQRCGVDVSMAPDFPEYNYKACHLADAEFHASSGKTGTRKCVGGWHDAGDFGRYIVNCGITMGTLLWTYELYEPKIRGIGLALPDSKKGVPDILTEIKWNLDWMLTMQDDDGGVWHKATTANFPGFILPVDDKAPMLIVGTGTAPYKNTTATGDFAAVCAIASRVYRRFDRGYSDKCLASAERAWSWLAQNPSVRYGRNPQGINTGGYGDSNTADEVLWAAAELYRTTGKKLYHDYFLANYKKWTPTVDGAKAQGWPELANMAMYTYALSGRKDVDPKAVEAIRADSIKAADDIVERVQGNAYRIPLKVDEYYWGSNAVVANYAMMLFIARKFQDKPSYLNGAMDMVHYLFGRNTFNTSYVTHVGSKYAMNPHHRPSAADKVTKPWPGLIVGGPNADRRTSPPPARQWQDVAASYTTNETAINWNAPLVFVLAGSL